MATKIACANNTFNTAATWAVVDSTSLLDSETGNDTLTTAYSGTRTASFTPGAIVVDGIAVKIYSVYSTPSGTMSIHIALNSDHSEVAGTEVVVNVSDLPTIAAAATSLEGGWFFFKFASPVTLVAATAYELEAKTSSASMVGLFRDSTSKNFSRMLRTTTTGAPAASDILHIMGEWTAAGTCTNRTVTMDQVSTSIVDIGSGTDNTTALTISKNGTLAFGTTAATNYYLKCSGNLYVYNGGTFTIGTVGTAIPRDSTAVLEFDPVADGGMGLIVRNGATLTIQGLSRTAGKNIYYCKLNTNEAANQTELGVDTDTGWLDNDEIAIATTSQTRDECEKGTLNGNADTSHLDVDGFAGTGGGIKYAHSGTSPTQAEIVLLTRNVKIRSATSTIMAYVSIGQLSTVDIDWAEFYYIGENATSKRGIDIAITTGTCNIAYCSFHDTEDYCIYCSTTSDGSGITLDSNVAFNVTTAINGAFIYVSATTGTPVVTNNVCIYAVGNPSGSGYDLADAGLTFQNNIAAGCANGIRISESSAIGTNSDNIAHGNSYVGLAIVGALTGGTLSNYTLWRNFGGGATGGGGLAISADARNVTFSGFSIFGNGMNSITMSAGANNLFTSCTCSSDSSFTTPNGIYFGGDVFNIQFENCSFGYASGIYTAHTSDINFVSPVYVKAILRNTLLASSSEIANQNRMADGSSIGSQKHDTSSGLHKQWKRYGTIVTDTIIFDTTPSMRMTPNNASYKLESATFRVAVASGATVTPSIKVRESVVGDGTNYNGNRIRLMLRKNIAIGIAADTVLDTATVDSDGAWETLTGTTAAATDDGVMEFFVDCDGTTGWINVDTFSVSSITNSCEFKYWIDSEPVVYGNNSAGVQTYIPRVMKVGI